MSGSETRDLERAALAGDEGAARKRAEILRRGSFDDALAGWVERLRGALVAHYRATYKSLDAARESGIRLEHGPKFVRVVHESSGSASAYAFVERSTGNILKPGGWKGPEPRRIVRGSIYAANPLAGCGPYGVAYANGSGFGGFSGEAASAAPLVVASVPAPEFTPTPLASGALVRVRETFGACRVLGPAILETATHWKYASAPSGRVKLAKKDASGKYAGAASPRPHVVPCTSCADHAESRFGPGRCSIHGQAEPCETCMSM